MLSALDAVRPAYLELLRAVDDPNRRVPRLTWNVGEVAAHTIACTRDYTAILQGRGSPWRATDVAAIAATSAGRLAEVHDRSGAVLAEQMDAAFAEVRAEIVRPDAPAVVAWHADIAAHRNAAAAMLVVDVAVHGLDIARALRRPWHLDPGLVDLVLPSIAPHMHHFVDRTAAAGFSATYRLRIRGHGDWYTVFDNGDLRIGTTAVGRVDCTINADPVAYLLAAYGRVGQVRPAPTGKVVVYGRKPWLGFKFAKLVVAP